MVLTLAAGCATPSDPGDGGGRGSLPDAEQPTLRAGGAHYRWVDETTVEAEGYLINVRNVTYTYPGFATRGALYGDQLHLAWFDGMPSGADWKPGEVRKWTARFDHTPKGPYKLGIRVDEVTSWHFLGNCLDPDGHESSSCTAPSPGRTAMKPADEQRIQSWFAECCNWTSPVFDVYDLVCQRVVNEVRCSATIWNFDHENHVPRARAIMRVASPDGPTSYNIAALDIETGGMLHANEARVTGFSIEIPAKEAANMDTTFEVELRAIHPDFTASYANESVVVDSEANTVL